ncbi:MAG: zinc metallopeptidase [Bacteroidales bacterium]|nr:zinc metallopeptidase [Candidatus Cryptobacteroides choladohippi]
MQLDGRRQSTNVDDRRGSSTAKVVGGIGLGGVVLIGLISMLLGVNPQQAIEVANQMIGTSEVVSDGTWEPSEQEQELAVFASQILAGTEDIWTEIFKANGRTYVPPKLVLFNGSVQSGCGGATSSSGPFYCSADQCVYLDLSFFTSMRQQIGADGDFAYAYVIAHEVGHHVQYLLGTLQQAHNQMSRVSEAQANQISVRLELQADFYAGVWAYNDNKRFKSLEAGDIQEAIDAAGKIGDDYLQKQSYGRTVPDSFTHGTSEQRSRWLTKGLRTGDVSLGDTFSQPYNQL